MDVFTGRFHNRLEDSPAGYGQKRLPASSAPNADQRGWLEGRRDKLRLSLTPATADELKQSLLLLFGGSREYGSSKDETRVKAAIYAETLIKAALPLWAVEAARDAFGRPGWKSLWDGKGIPGRADVVAECRYILLPVETELARIEAVLGAEVYETGASADERTDAVDRWWTEVRPGMARDSAISQRTDDEIAAEVAALEASNARFRERDRARAEASGRGQLTWGRLPISDELARSVGLVVPVPGEINEGVR